MSQEPRPDTVENEFREATRPIFQQRSATANGAEACDGAASTDPREPEASVNEGSDTFEAVVDAVSATDGELPARFDRRTGTNPALPHGWRKQPGDHGALPRSFAR